MANRVELVVISLVIGSCVWRGVIGGEISPKGVNSLTIQRTHLTITTFRGNKATKPARARQYTISYHTIPYHIKQSYEVNNTI